MPHTLRVGKYQRGLADSRLKRWIDWALIWCGALMIRANLILLGNNFGWIVPMPFRSDDFYPCYCYIHGGPGCIRVLVEQNTQVLLTLAAGYNGQGSP